MLDTATQVYYAFLDGIKKTYTSTVEPYAFNRIMNEWGVDEWLKSKVSDDDGVEISQKIIDDLQKLIVVTDGQMIYNGDVMYPIAPDVANGYTFSKPAELTLINNNQSLTQIYPAYLRRLSIAFKLNYVDNICGLTGVSDKFLKAQFMRSFERNIIEDNHYRYPKDDRLYWDMIYDKFNLITGTASNGNCMRIEYLRYPSLFFFDPNRNAKGLLSILTNSIVAGSAQLSVTTTAGTYTTPILPVASGRSKYVLANSLYQYILTNIPALDACWLNGNNLSIGQNGYDVTAMTLTLTIPNPITYTITIGSTVSDVNLELDGQQRKEIVEHAVRVFLERITDARYKTFLNEEGYRGRGRK
jgi:hypothetical protein